MRLAEQHIEQKDVELIGRCLRAVREKNFFPVWEFQTLFGIEKEDFVRSTIKWPNVDLDNQIVSNSVVGAMNHLLGYPHNMDDQLFQYTKATNQNIRDSLSRIIPIIDHT